jgi:arabinoxylan arabinofuranohydrolase
VRNDSYDFRTLNNNQPVNDSKQISLRGGKRVPMFFEVSMGKYSMMFVIDMGFLPKVGILTKRWVLLKSTDLVNWSSSVINI